MENTHPLIAKILAMPKTHKVITTYEDGRAREFLTQSLAQAENHAVSDRRKIGRDLIERESGNIVRVVSVEVKAI
jgi:Trp operon repressor